MSEDAPSATGSDGACEPTGEATCPAGSAGTKTTRADDEGAGDEGGSVVSEESKAAGQEEEAKHASGDEGEVGADGKVAGKADGTTENDATDEKHDKTEDQKVADVVDQKDKPADDVGDEPAGLTDSTSGDLTPAAGEVVVVSGVNISEVTDQDKLHELLEQCDNFDERKKIRARLMTLMQEVRARREQASRRRLEHQQQRDGGSVSQHEAKMINDWLSDNFDSDGKDSTSESKTTSSSSVTTKTSTSRTVASSPRTPLSKGKAPVSAFDKFKQLDSANPRAMPPRTDSAASDGSGGGGFKLDPGLAAKAQSAKEMTLYWAQSRVREYKNVKVENFSTSWNNGMAFCALIHHFYPDAFDFDKLDPKNRRYNFDLAFNTADEKAGIFPLLDTDDMVAMKKPDWKCVFTYVQAIYRRLKNGP